ncbi:hypothetical protein Ppa06_39810 [Planomonospora parontospora subsp. parontospora]|uniref:Uncharacterized protein n=2 Tax=Planomonospora parontospora TaxID=58119 RepID=A0AA37BJ06_9ACTN|nr:hypothetical protein [Planomonospora parontospora]GGK76085.1 hypothetical protein GCM10010126_39110 [Planomonospora parontospora]GII10183.1 hypothetical protein Ppa06_39810 [Planomonospora parontospora subsp. parontospora]
MTTTPIQYAGKTATTSVPVHPLLAERWSPRGLDATHTLAEARLHALLEAARERAPRSRHPLEALLLPAVPAAPEGQAA